MPAGIGIGAGGLPPNHGSVTIGTTPTLILAKNPYRVSVTLDNTTSVIIYVGNSNVSASPGNTQGKPIFPGGSFTTENRNDLYGIVSAGAPSINFWEESNP